MLLKILGFIVVAVLIYIFFFKNKRKEEIRNQKKDLEADTMVECKRCGTFVSHKDAIIKDGQFLCSKECARIQP